MASENEKLCMAIIKNATITNIDWPGVASELGVEKVNTVQVRWHRFQKAKFGQTTNHPKTKATATKPTTQVKTTNGARSGANMEKKRDANDLEEMMKAEEEEEQEVFRNLPSRKSKDKRVKYELSGDEEEDEKQEIEEVDQIGVKECEDENNEFEEDKDTVDDEA